ncbi:MULTISPECIES: S24 family peptidase [Bacillus]|uniref:LexA family protein n=1 Tax=Bacillaceae TaxID=186817 RepID=UPI0007B07784|nr:MULTISPECIES: S24 family peptidase [Bacillus]KZN99984.1 hypothetical protein A4244_03535 [Bacillus badius]OCS86149.1 hypothetical protein A6M11_03535 [Bacillus badius]OVE52390.1 hypothetical protein B1A98_08350 [Bacillus badius]TDW04125.1 hypothetical protein B0G66_103426 [Bacillus badius]
MREFASLLKQYIKSSGLSLNTIVEDIKEMGYSMSKSYLSNLQNDKADPPDPYICAALAKVTGNDPKALIMASFHQDIPDHFKDFLSDVYINKDDIPDFEYQSDGKTKKFFLETYWKELSTPPEKALFNVYRPIPLLDKIYPGATFYDNDIIGEYYVDRVLVRGVNGFALKVYDDSMSLDNITHGDTVVAVKTDDWDETDLLVVSINNQPAIITRLQQDLEFSGGYIVRPSNPKYPLRFVDNKSIDIIGVVIYAESGKCFIEPFN